MEFEDTLIESPFRLPERLFAKVTQFYQEIAPLRCAPGMTSDVYDIYNEKIRKSLNEAYQAASQVMFSVPKNAHRLYVIGLYSLAIGTANGANMRADLANEAFGFGIFDETEITAVHQITKTLGTAYSSQTIDPNKGLAEIIDAEVQAMHEHADFQEAELGVPHEPLYMASLLIGAGSTRDILFSDELRNRVADLLVDNF